MKNLLIVAILILCAEGLAQAQSQVCEQIDRTPRTAASPPFSVGARLFATQCVTDSRWGCQVTVTAVSFGAVPGTGDVAWYTLQLDVEQPYQVPHDHEAGVKMAAQGIFCSLGPPPPDRCPNKDSCAVASSEFIGGVPVLVPLRPVAKRQ